MAKPVAVARAISLGRISPKISTTDVVIITCRVTTEERFQLFLSAIPIAIRVDSEEIPMFTKVLPKRMVTSSCLGLPSRERILRDCAVFLFSSFFKYILESEKNAVSEPEKKADNSNNIISINAEPSSKTYSPCIILL